MTFMSATVPVITEEDERKEFKSLTEQEQASIEADVFGLSYENTTKDGRGALNLTSEEAWCLLRDAIEHNSDNGSIKKAMMLCPELIMTESNPTQFLRCENFHTSAAADRLINYWKLRLSLFGCDRAFLPMTLEGAMQEDRTVLETFAVAMALGEDGAGRPVLLWDRVQAAEMDRCRALRCLFYTCSTLIRRKTVCDEGCVVLINYNGCNDIRKYYDRFVTRHVVAIGKSVPFHLCSVHFYTGLSRRNVAGLLLPVVKQLAGRTLRLRFQIHCGCELANIFARYKLTAKHAEIMLGSLALQQEVAACWIQEQEELERQNM